PSARTGGVFTVYMATVAAGGTDANSGLSAQQPVTTLARVQQILQQNKPHSDVEVRIRQGRYASPPLGDWHTYIPGHTISFMPADYKYGDGIADIAGRPVFDNPRASGGGYASGWWLVAKLPGDPADPMHNGGTSGLRFYYLAVQHYNGGISLWGDSGHDTTDNTYNPPLRSQPTPGLNGNTIYGMAFQWIGTKYVGGTFGYGAVLLTDSSNNRIDNNHFTQVENSGSLAGLIHGVYVTHFSSSNQIDNNDFTTISSDPVKLRDRSSNNNIQGNTFRQAGRNSFYREEFCDTQCAAANAKARECASYHNRFAYNHDLSSYGGATIPAWSLSPSSNTATGAAPCSIPAGATRLHTAGNSTT
ncbi:MAG: right-handed parallel beta-helix repeat-containing protein, partial [Micromonosporaceae bacterium]|nr:right-handed parallel beta-helix repeat-containing protein [Micromonosporaceae bacterium]